MVMEELREDEGDGVDIFDDEFGWYRFKSMVIEQVGQIGAMTERSTKPVTSECLKCLKCLYTAATPYCKMPTTYILVLQKDRSIRPPNNINTEPSPSTCNPDAPAWRQGGNIQNL